MQNQSIRNYKIKVIAVRFVLLFVVLISIIYIISSFGESAVVVDMPARNVSLKSSSVESYAAKPEFLGLDKDDLPFKIQADSGVQKDGKNFELQNITVTYSLKGDEALVLEGSAAEYNLDTKMLELKDGVQALHSKGYAINVKHVDWDLLTKKMKGAGDVIVTADFGEIDSDNFHVSDSYSKLEFFNNSGRVKTTLNK